MSPKSTFKEEKSPLRVQPLIMTVEISVCLVIMEGHEVGIDIAFLLHVIMQGFPGGLGSNFLPQLLSHTLSVLWVIYNSDFQGVNKGTLSHFVSLYAARTLLDAITKYDALLGIIYIVRNDLYTKHIVCRMLFGKQFPTLFLKIDPY